jgi:hypothetical protein
MANEFSNGSTGEYWSGLITRKEAQDVFDQYSVVLVGLKESQLKFEFVVGYILDRFEVTPAQIQEYMDRKMQEHLAAQKSEDSTIVS